MSTQQKIALVTGANKGIGFETVRQLGKLGIKVILGARDASRGESAAETLRGENLDVEFLLLNPTDPASIADAVKVVTQKYDHLDILVNNAGWGSMGQPASQETYDNWKTTFEINVFGLVAVTQAFLPLIKKSEAGRIVNLTSILGSIALTGDPKSPIGPRAGTGAAYAASKSAVNMFTAQLAAELKGTAIKVNAAHPGWVKTDLGGPGAPMELPQGARTSVALATLPEDGPTGAFIHQGKPLPW